LKLFLENKSNDAGRITASEGGIVVNNGDFICVTCILCVRVLEN